MQEPYHSLTQKLLFVIFSGSGHLGLVAFLISKETIGENFAIENFHKSKANKESIENIEEKKTGTSTTGGSQEAVSSIEPYP